MTTQGVGTYSAKSGDPNLAIDMAVDVRFLA